MRTAILAALVLACVTLSAEARPRTYAVSSECNVTMPCEGVGPTARGAALERAPCRSVRSIRSKFRATSVEAKRPQRVRRWGRFEISRRALVKM